MLIGLLIDGLLMHVYLPTMRVPTFLSRRFRPSPGQAVQEEKKENVHLQTASSSPTTKAVSTYFFSPSFYPTSPSREALSYAFYVSTFLIILAVFIHFAPLSYGLKMTKEQCMSLKWLSGWDFDCSNLVSTVAPSASS